MLGLALALNAVQAVKPNGPAAYNGLNKGKSDIGHLELYQKNLTTWQPVEDGAFGRMTFNESDFVFNGHGLKTKTDYTLIRYNDPWPGKTVCLASGTSNDEGNLHLRGAMQEGGPKVWLVLSGDVKCGDKMVGWHGADYLFEYDLLQ